MPDRLRGQRTTAAVQGICRRHGEKEFAGWLAEQRQQDRHFGDLKRADALAALRTALDSWAPRAGAQLPIATTYFRRWSNAFCPSVS
ncbi:hypothetical protein [Streptantibioticus ferralitis]|uniref:Transposase n=1 Tax=Streptantibioticus ferralitis TaxID=236510 RepID=A0ABT5Z8C3_9ACTN|nr:hypothetical protein [Streptantibioticus ferralitis]MDF2260073.1 hypothetical protein [Streptantibioticus ferralitis]